MHYSSMAAVQVLLVALSLLPAAAMALQADADLPGRASTVISWASHPIQPNQTLLLQVSPLQNGSMFEFRATQPRTTAAAHVHRGDGNGDGDGVGDVNFTTSARVVSVTVAPEYVTDAGAAVVVPASMPHNAVFTVAVVEPATKVAGPPLVINQAEISWVQGSEGESTQPGGWIRCFGRSLGFVPIGQVRPPPTRYVCTKRARAR